IRIPGDRIASTVGCGPGQTLIVAGSGSLVPSGIGPYRPTVPVWVFDRSGEAIRHLVDVPGIERYYDGRSIRPRQLGKSIVFGASCDRLLLGLGDAFELYSWGRSDESPDTIRWPGDARAVTQAMLERVIENALRSARTREQRKNWERELRELEIPHTLPAYQALLVGPGGYVWLKNSEVVEGDAEHRSILDIDRSKVLGSVVFPRGFDLLELTESWAVGRWIDSLGLHYVDLYE